MTDRVRGSWCVAAGKGGQSGLTARPALAVEAAPAWLPAWTPGLCSLLSLARGIGEALGKVNEVGRRELGIVPA